MHMASANGHVQVVTYLVSQGCSLNLQNKSLNTALHWAAMTGYPEVVKLLGALEKCDPNMKNAFGKTAFEEALQARQTECAEFLATISKLDDDRFYSEIPEQQWLPEFNNGEKQDDSQVEESKSERSLVSEEAMRDCDIKQSIEEINRAEEMSEQRRIEDLNAQIRDKFNLGEDVSLQVNTVREQK